MGCNGHAVTAAFAPTQRRARRSSDYVLAIMDREFVLAQELHELIAQLPRESHRPCVPERELRVAGRGSIVHADLAIAARERLQRALQIADERAEVAVPRNREPTRLLLDHLVGGAHALHGDAPA